MRNSKNYIKESDISDSANSILLVGTLEGAPIYSHTYDEVQYYSIRIRVMRANSSKYDLLHAFIPDSFLTTDGTLLDEGVRVELEGYLVQSELKSRSDVSIVTNRVRIADSDMKDTNNLYIGGVIHQIFDLRSIEGSPKVVKPMILKHTNVTNGKVRYLTLKVSSWNSAARLVDSKYKEGDKVMIRGQLESKAVKLDNKKSSVILHEASAVLVLSVPEVTN